MKIRMQSVMCWTPRVLGIVFALFVSMFALDVFGEENGFWKTTIALLLHLIPTGVILVVLAIAWRWEWVGVIFFPALALWYLLAMWGRFRWPTYVVIAGPLFLIGFFFLGDWLYQARLRRRNTVESSA
jgi:hypothetical protein